MNSINIIHPYRVGRVWVFDDERVGLRAEPFVGGTSEIIDRLTESMPKATGGVTILFSGSQFSGYQHNLQWVREDFGGNVYRIEALEMEGWLCPALFKYFDQAPSDIYIQIVEKGVH